MSSPSAQILDLLKSSTVRGLAGRGGVWRLDGTSTQVESLRQHILDLAVRTSSPVFVHYDGEAPEEPSLAEAQALSVDLWRLPSSATGRDLSSWLYMGNWQLYSREEPLAKLEDLCRADDEGVMHFLRASGVDFVIDSFHDDVHWTIGLSR